MSREKVTVWERVDNPEKNKIMVYKKHKRVLHETRQGGEYYIYFHGYKCYVGFYKGE